MTEGFFKDYVGKPCSGRTAFEFIPKTPRKVDLEALSQGLKEKGRAIEAETPFILVLHVNDLPVSVFKNGKMLVRDTQDEQEAKHAVGALVGLLEACSTP